MNTRIIFDENISWRVVEFLNREARLAEMTHLRKVGWSGLPDTEWLTLAIQRNFVVVSGDRNERTRGYTVNDLKQMGARVLLLGQFWDHMKRWERAKWMVNHIEQLVQLANQIQKGEVYLVYKNGRWRKL